MSTRLPPIAMCGLPTGRVRRPDALHGRPTADGLPTRASVTLAIPITTLTFGWYARMAVTPTRSHTPAAASDTRRPHGRHHETPARGHRSWRARFWLRVGRSVRRGGWKRGVVTFLVPGYSSAFSWVLSSRSAATIHSESGRLPLAWANASTRLRRTYSPGVTRQWLRKRSNSAVSGRPAGVWIVQLGR